MTDQGYVATFGETMALARMSGIGSLRHASHLALGIGGAESNVAIGLRRLGVATSWVGRVGDDPLGERVVRELRAESVDVRPIVDAERATGLMLAERPSASSTAVHYYRSGSAGSRLSPGDLPRGWVESALLLHVTGITALVSDSARDCLLSAVDRARTAGVAVSFDVNHRSTLASRHDAAPVLRAIAERADIVFGGEDELTLLYPDVETDAEAAVRLHACGVSRVVVKRGAAGAAEYSGAVVTESAGVPIDPVDTVGAGDAFVAGYLSAHLGGLDTVVALARGNACGALACLVPGDWEAAPTLREIERFRTGGADPVQR